MHSCPIFTGKHEYGGRLTVVRGDLRVKMVKLLKFHSFQFCAPRMKARESSEYTDLFHFSWDSRIHWTHSVFSQWFTCEIEKIVEKSAISKVAV